MIFNSKVKKVIDSHMHIYEAIDNDGNLFLNSFDKYVRDNGFSAINVNALPSHDERSTCNNILVAFCKLAGENVYAHGGLVYDSFPAKNPAPRGMDARSQYLELMDIGFDGMKIFETKPTTYKKIGIELCDEFYEPFFSEAEKDKTHLLVHANDPEDFWDKNPSQWLKDVGWWYGDGTYATNEEVYSHIEKILERHPSLTVTFAHFFFLSCFPERLKGYFEKYKNMCVDLTPGGEMYLAFEANKEYYKQFFKTYSDRILYGTDCSFPCEYDVMESLAERVYRYICTPDTLDAFYSDNIITGLDLPIEHAEKILHGNFIRRVGESPRPINKTALKKYIEKYRHLISDKQMLDAIDMCSKKLL